MEMHRTAIQIVLVMALSWSATQARAADTENYCILGTGDGLSWDWEVRFFSSTANEIDRCTGTAMAPGGAPATEIRDVLMKEINDGCGIVVEAATFAGCGPNAGFTANGYFDFELWLEQKVASPPGPLVQVTAGTPVLFNPYIAVPEPSRASLLGSGLLALAGLRRLDRRRQRRRVAGPAIAPVTA